MSVFQFTEYEKTKKLCDRIDSCIANAKKIFDDEEKAHKQYVSDQNEQCLKLMKEHGITTEMMDNEFNKYDRYFDRPRFPEIFSEVWSKLRDMYKASNSSIKKHNPYMFSTIIYGSNIYPSMELIARPWIHPELEFSSELCGFTASIDIIKRRFGMESIQYEISEKEGTDNKIHVCTIDFSSLKTSDY